MRRERFIKWERSLFVLYLSDNYEACITKYVV